jgi:hypothetical protein
MDYKKKLNQVKVLLGLSVRMSQDTLQDGTQVEAEDFTEGNVVYEVAEDGSKAPLEAGDYELSDGTQITVDAEGEITEVKGEDSEEGEEDEKMDDEEAPAAMDDAEGDMKKFKKSKKVAASKNKKATRKFDDEAPAAMDDEMPQAMDEQAVDAKMDEALKKVAMAIEPIIKSHEEMKARLEKCEEEIKKISKAPAAAKIAKMGDESQAGNSLNEAEMRIQKFNELRQSLNK